MKKFFSYSLIITLFIALISIILSVYIFNKWDSTFRSSADSDGMTYLNLKVDRYGDVREDIESKINRYSSSENRVDFIELTPVEFGVLFYDHGSEAFPEGVSIREIYIDTESFEWFVYMKLEYKGVELPWVGIELSKDNQETAEIYVSEVRIGSVDLSEIGFKSIEEDLSDGYLDALGFVNENNITERKFENIELTEEGLFIKGSREE